MKHFVHYIKRQVVDPAEHDVPGELPYVEKQPEGQGFESPAYHYVPLNSGAASRVDKRDRIWLFSQLSSPWGRLPPSLDGMIEVAEISKDARMAGGYWFGAGENSKWYNLCDASDLIEELSVIDSQANIRCLLSPTQTTIGQAARFIMQVAAPKPLTEHAKRVYGVRPDFISYRMVDGTQSAFELVKQIMASGRAVFWDRWSLPRRLAERNESVGQVVLDSHIAQKIRSSRVAWGVTSEKYGVDGSYSKLEKDLAEELGKFRPYPPWQDG